MHFCDPSWVAALRYGLLCHTAPNVGKWSSASFSNIYVVIGVVPMECQRDCRRLCVTKNMTDEKTRVHPCANCTCLDMRKTVSDGITLFVTASQNGWRASRREHRRSRSRWVGACWHSPRTVFDSASPVLGRNIACPEQCHRVDRRNGTSTGGSQGISCSRILPPPPAHISAPVSTEGCGKTVPEEGVQYPGKVSRQLPSAI